MQNQNLESRIKTCLGIAKDLKYSLDRCIAKLD